ncbi:MAG TPA: glycosyltransferase family 2 protein, partial [Acidimicrobiia bacterium]
MSLPDNDLDGTDFPPELDEQDEGALDVAPPVVVVVVTRNPGPFLESALEGLGSQDYPTLSVLVVDAGSTVDPGPRVAAVLPDAFVHRGPGSRPGFGGAANEALELVDGAAFFLVCHDDAVLAPDAVRLVVEEAYRSNAAIVGPKLVSSDDPEALLEVGRTIDRLGGSHTGIEPGELDQEQHDAVRDVFYVSSAALLVRADLFAELGGFDPETFPGSEDLDLCWRARLAGARVVVAPDARAAHVEAASARRPGDAPTARDVARRRVRVLLTCYSFSSLLRVIPIGIALAFFEALVFAPTPRRRQATAVIGAWRWNLVHLARLRAARRRAQALRTIHD